MVVHHTVSGKAARIDESDKDLIERYSWQLSHQNGYARNPDHRLYLHVLVADRSLGPNNQNLDVDHINGDKLDNRRSNLRYASRSHNMANTPMRATNTSGYKGVCRNKNRRKWVSQITVDYKRICLGYYDDKREAAKAYDRAAIQYFGEFAHTNFPREDYG